MGLIAIGTSGALAGVFGKTFGWNFIAGDQPGVTYTAARCAEYLRLSPGATDCTQTALTDHYWEVVGYRIAAGILGVMAMGAYLVVRRTHRPNAARLPRGFNAIIGSALFGLAALGLLGVSTMNIVFSNSSGAGGLLSGGIVSLIVFAAFGLRFVCELTSPAAA